MHSYHWGKIAFVSVCLATFVGCGDNGSDKKIIGGGGSGGGAIEAGVGGGTAGGSGGGTSVGGGGGTAGAEGGVVDGGGKDGGGKGATDGGGGTAGAGGGGGASGGGGAAAGGDAGPDADAGDAGGECNNTADCGDKDVCDGTTTCINKKCVKGPAPVCTTSNPCLQAACDPVGGCYTQPLTGVACNDNNPCTATDVCSAGVCVGTGTVSCDDSNPCTDDSCSTVAGCTNTANSASCNDGNPCTVNDVCSNKACTGTAASCNDSNPCTTDTCDPTSGCKNTNATDGTGCGSDGNPCTLDTCLGGVCHTPADPTTQCRAPSCTSGVATAEAFCGGSSSCPSAVTASCSSGLCDQGATGTACSGTCPANPCPGGSYCDTLAGSCTPQKSLGQACTGNSQCSNGQCVDGVCCATPCGGGNPNDCQVCQAGTGTCQSLDGVTCDDGNFCTDTDSCTTGACIGIPVLCDDGNPCTADACNPKSGCITPPAPDGTACNDSNACTTVDSCLGGACNGTVPLVCDDGIFCDGVETCSPSLGCQAGTPVVCPDDGKTCTANFCDESLGACRTLVQDTLCSDGLFCTGVEKCDPTNPTSNATTGCAAGTPIVCNDSLDCTADACNEALKKCTFTANSAFCSDGNACNGTEICDTNAAPGTGCKSGTPINCSDNVACTVDTCNPSNGACSHTNTDSLCSDGVFCNGAEVCNPAGNPGPSGCGAGTPVSCPPDGDPYPCTQNVCDAALTGQDSCTIYYNSSVCVSGACTASGCGSTCTVDANCSDSNACNGIETCDLSGGGPTGICKPGTPPPPCDDGHSCTTDSCNPSTGACVYTKVNSRCADSNLCNGTEVCDAGVGTDATGCIAGTALNCDDGKSCTVDSCVPASGCLNSPDNTKCPDDGNVCNGTASCSPLVAGSDPTTGCVTSAPLTCASDGIACTNDSCNPTVGCVHIPDSTKCPCGQTCSVSGGGCGNFCVAALPPAGNEATCQGKVYQCGDCVDNDGDCGIDTLSDPDCLGPCQDNEKGFHGDIAGQAHGACNAVDCYFDQDSGAGNDHCNWDYNCDPNSVSPNYYPLGDSHCVCTPTGLTPPPVPNCSASDCKTLYSSQPAGCWSTTAPLDPTQNYCGLLVPNGCDCFGCCTVPGVAYPIYLGSEGPTKVTPYSNANGTCALAVKTDPTKCHPCTQVASCLKPCGLCDICVGKPLPDPSCTQQTCPAGETLCGGNTGLTCAPGKFCLTGCCVPVPT